MQIYDKAFYQPKNVYSLCNDVNAAPHRLIRRKILNHLFLQNNKFIKFTASALLLLLALSFPACSSSDGAIVSENQTARTVSSLTISENNAIDPSAPRTYTLSVNPGAYSLTQTDTAADLTAGDPEASSAGTANDPTMSGLVPETVTFYKNTYGGAAYDNVTFSLENGILYLESTPDISDAMLTNAHIRFELPKNENADDAVQTGDDTTTIEILTDAESSNDIDLTQNPRLKITASDGISVEYPILVRRQTFDIPTLYLTTDTGEPITSKEEYVSGNLILDGNSYEVSLRGRGNTSWRYFPQKSYLIKFDERISLFGMLASEKYALVSTYKDLSLVRNCVAMDIAACMDQLEYTPSQILVDVYLNGEYRGVYTFSEKIEEDIQKVNLFSNVSRQTLWHHGEEDIGFLLECGGDLMHPHVYGQEYFTTPHSPKFFINYPEIEEPYNDTFDYIADYMNATDRAITRGYGYEEYIDVDSWVDWFIVMELTNNTDSAFWRSTFLYKRPGEKLMIGPVWDFDMAFGNFEYDNPTYAYWSTAEQIYSLTQDHYFSYLYKSDEFMLAVRERWDEVKEDLLATALESVDRHAALAEASRVYNNHVRGVSNSAYQVTALKAFIQRRYDWIDMSIHMSDFNRHAPTQSIPEETPEDAGIILDENGNPVGIIPVDGMPVDGNPVEVSQNIVPEQ